MTFPLFTEWALWLFVVLAPVLVLVVVRALRVVTWAFSLTREIRDLKTRAKAAPADEAAAIAVVVSRCESILNAPYPELPTLEGLYAYLTEVASAFHPEAKRPELKVSIGHLIRTLNRSIDRFETVLERPGVERLRRVRIATVKTNARRFQRLSAFPPVRWYLRFRQWLSGMNVLRLLLIPDPVSWLIYLSSNLSVMVLGKCLLVDLQLFVGRTALELYGDPLVEGDARALEEENPQSVEEALEELQGLDDAPPVSMDPALAPLRKRITGLSAFLHTTPDLKTFRDTVVESAEIIAQSHFPESENPLDETRIGPILERTRHLLADVGKGEEIPVAGRIYRVRLDTLESARRFADETIPKSVKDALTTGKKAYTWLKWPLAAYRLTAKGGLFKVAAGLGWRTAGKGITLFLYGRLYDRSMEEVDGVCKRSKEM
ncbi:hypothetical protein DSLASN_38110 [Desulfoluna limicola]|uniref:Uncharacterized protein n=1 Tax=Desulfoluna limicola TaxID=2810562 RepID=A0ABN6F773_9BACT|nr:hypothetical protein [Desulfoluna limicola]BCS98179.1 hypothetical protein DSLASN_38110 [Desulfoluna limicola]